QPSSSQVVLLRAAKGVPVAFEQFLGRGRVVVLADPLPLCNGYLEVADNWRLAADLISLAPAGVGGGFDEDHHGAAGQGSPVSGLLSTGGGAAIGWGGGGVFVGFFRRGPGLGPRLSLPGRGAGVGGLGGAGGRWRQVERGVRVGGGRPPSTFEGKGGDRPAAGRGNASSARGSPRARGEPGIRRSSPRPRAHGRGRVGGRR